MNSMKRQKYMALKDELPRLVDAQYATGEEWRNSSRKDEEAEPKWNQLWLWLVMEVIPEKRREAKGKGEKEGFTYLNAEFQRIAKGD